MDHLKLIALDQQDLEIVSAHVQDAITKVGDLSYLASERRFIAPVNRFVWEKQTGLFPGKPERRNCVLHFERVSAVRISGVEQRKKDEVLALLALQFHGGDEAPAGVIELVFSGGAAIQLTVECIEARLSDLGGAWEASSRPRHSA